MWTLFGHAGTIFGMNLWTSISASYVGVHQKKKQHMFTRICSHLAKVNNICGCSVTTQRLTELQTNLPIPVANCCQNAPLVIGTPLQADSEAKASVMKHGIIADLVGEQISCTGI